MLQRAFRQRIGVLRTCVGLESILNDDIAPEEDGIVPLSLRKEASCKGLTYLQVIKYLPHADLYLARVASSSAKLAESEILAFFTEDQLTYTLPLDMRVQHKRPDQIIAAIIAHAATQRPSVMLAPVGEHEAVQVSEQDFSELVFHPLAETIELTSDELQAAMQATVIEQQEDSRRVGVSPTEAAQMLQQALLLGALDKQIAHLWETPNQARSLTSQARCKLLVGLRRWQEKTRQKVVNAHARWSQALGQVVYELRIGVPVQLG